MSKVMLSLATGLPSHFQIGDVVLFCASGVTGIGSYQYIPAAIVAGCPKCRVISVKFTRSKVIYAVEVYCEYADGTGEYYESFPLENIDSTFLHETNQARAYSNFLEHMKKPYMADTVGYNNGDIDPTIFPPGVQMTGMQKIFGFFGDSFQKMFDEERARRAIK